MINVQCVTVCPEIITLKVGDWYYGAKAEIYPSNATNKKINWSSGKPDVASVNESNGYIKAISAGMTKVYAHSDENKNKYGTIIVEVIDEDKVSSISVNPSNITLQVGERIKVCASVAPDTALNKLVNWCIEKDDIASLEANRYEGFITGHKVGSTWLQVTATDGSGTKKRRRVVVKETNTTPTEHKETSSTPGSTVADPVDAFTGAHLLKNKVYSLFGGQNLSLELQYNSVNLIDGCFGTGWYHNYEKHLEEKECEIWVYTSPASYLKFTSNDGITYNCTTAGKTGYVLTVDRASNTPYCLNCNKERKEFYDANGKIKSIENRQGFVTEITEQNNLIVITDTITGKSMYLLKNADGKIESVYEQENLRTAHFAYECGNLVSITDPNGKTLSFTYDAVGRVLTGTDSKGVKYFDNTYDEYGRVSEQKDGKNSPATKFEYGENGERIITNRNGDVSTRIFDSNGMLISHTDEDGNTKTYEYDANFNLIKETDALGNSVKKVYNSFNKPTEIIDKNGNKTIIEYDDRGNPLKIIYPDANGVERAEHFQYNEQNQLTQHTDLRNIVTVYTYDENGMPHTKKVGGKNASLYVYENGLLKSETDPLGNKVQYTYNTYGMVETKTDVKNGVTRYEHDLIGNLLKTTDALEKTTVTVYDGNYQKEYVTDANENTTQYGYDGNMKNNYIKLPDNSVITYIYDNEDRLTQAIDGANNITLTEYYKSGKVKSKKAADGGKFSYEYDAAGNVVKETNPKDAVTLKTYDAAGNVLTVTDSEGNITRNQYDNMSRLIRSVNAVSGTTVYEYSLAGDLLSVTDGMGNKKHFTYDDFGNKLTETDAKGNTTVYTYDANNNPLTVTDALGHTTTYTYDSQNLLKTVRNAKGAVITYDYDPLGRRTSVTDAKGNTFTTVYDAMGNVLETLDADENTVTETKYNNLNLPHIVTDAQGKTLTYLYNSIGKVDTVTNSDNKVKSYHYDSVGRLRQVTDEKSGISYAVFDVFGNITSLSGPLGSTVNYIYDDKGRLISESTSSGGTVQYGYNELSLKEQLTNARGQKRKYFYDALGRVTGYVGAEDSVSYTYDANGNVLTVTDKNGTVTRTYDALNRVSSYTDTYGNTINYSYDSVGNLQTLIYPDNTAVNYTYDVNNNLETVTDWSGRVTRYSYDKNNRVTGVIKPDGSITTTAYDNKQRIVSTTEKTASGTVITGFEYIYDALSRIVEEKCLAENRKMCYTYDELDRVRTRLIKDLNGNVLSEESFNYDAAGNITAANNESLSYDTNNRLTEYLGHAVEYDADGNMLSNGLLSFEYDSANRLLKAGDNAYTYNAEDVRIKNLCGDFETTYTYNTNCKLSHLLCKTTNGITTKYVYGLGLIGQEKENEFKTYHFDYRGSTVAITNINGTITDTFKYNTYGKLIERTGDSFIIFGYNGRDGVITDNNGLIYMRARYYSPDMRRFVNADILHGEISDSTSLNRYSYVNGNPVSFVDPFGLSVDEGRGDRFNNWFDKAKDLFAWTVDEFKRLTAEGKLDWFLKLTLGAEKDNNDIYHIRQDWWQSWNIIGYNDIYDIAFNIGTGVTGTTMAREKFPFTSNGKEYIVWVWKGDYINLGSGAEAGIYEKSAIPGHWLTSTDNNLKMSLSLKEIDSGDILFNYSPTQPQWWITGFDPSNQDAQSNNLQSTVTIDFSQNADLYEGFSAAYKNNLDSPWKFDGKVATLIW